MDAALLTLLNQVVTIEPATGVDEYGKTVYGTAITVNALITGKPRLVRDMQGEDVVSSEVVYVDGSTVVTPLSRLTLPDGIQPVILAIETMPDIDGTTFVKVIYT